MSEPIVLYEHRGPAAVITLNRPDKLNALSRALIASLREAFERAAQDAEARCVVLTGAGKAFCAGMDLAELSESLEHQHEPEGQHRIWEDAYKLALLLDLIYSLPKPTVAAVNGAAVAGGAGLVTVCDLALAAKHARLGYPEVRRGLVAAMVMPHLLRHVGERMARYLLLSGELITADEAETWGLVNESLPAEQLRSRTEWLCGALAEGGPGALVSTKTLLKSFSRQALSVEETARASAAPRVTEECQAGLKAFFAKKPVPWARQ